MIDKNELQTLLASIDLTSLIEQRSPTRFGGPQGNGTKRTVKGPCPFCQGTDRFAVFVNDSPQRYYCGIHGNGCGKHGDAITFLMEYDNVTFLDAVAILQGDTGALNITPKRIARSKGYDYTSDRWQREVTTLVTGAQAALWMDSGADVLDYLWQRGFEDETIKEAHLGYAMYKGGNIARNKDHKVPCLVIPWFDSKKGIYTRVTFRDITAIDTTERYSQHPGGSNEALYGASRLNRPVILVEGELDALTIVQEMRELLGHVAIVATGSTGANRTVKPLMRLSAAPHVFVAFDAEERGEQGATYWLDHLPNATRWMTPIGKDANECFLHGIEIKAWVQAALRTLIEPEPIVLSPVERIARKVFGEGGYTITPVPKDYTHAQRIADLGLKPRNLEMYCSVCRYEKAAVLWIGGQPYCHGCQDKERKTA